MSKSPQEAPWFTPIKVMQMPDGSFLLRPGKPIQRASIEQTSKWTGVSKKTLRRLAESGFIRCARVTAARHYYYPGEIEEFIAKTEADPDYWTPERIQHYLGVRRLREKSPERPDQDDDDAPRDRYPEQ